MSKINIDYYREVMNNRIFGFLVTEDNILEAVHTYGGTYTYSTRGDIHEWAYSFSESSPLKTVSFIVTLGDFVLIDYEQSKPMGRICNYPERRFVKDDMLYIRQQDSDNSFTPYTQALLKGAGSQK